MRKLHVVLLSAVVLALLMSLTACEDKDVVAKVGPEKIKANELREAFKRKADLLGINSISTEMKRDVLDLMIEREVLYLYARDKDMKVSETRLQEKLKDVPPSDMAKQRRALEKHLLIEQAYSDVTKGTEATPEDTERYYQEHQDAFRVPTMYKVYLVKVKEQDADHVLEKSKEDPEAFNDMALNTETPELRQINKNAPFTPKDGFPDEMVPFLEKMKKGDIAGPVKVERGLFLFKLVDKEQEHVQPLHEVAVRIEHTILQQKRDEEFEKWFEQQKKKYSVRVLIKDIESLER